MKYFKNFMESQDGLVLAVRFLNGMGISCLQLSKQYGLSRNTLSDILHGRMINKNLRQYEMMLMLAMRQLLTVAQCCGVKRSKSGHPVSPEQIKDVIIEVSSLNLGLPRNEVIWQFWARN